MWVGLVKSVEGMNGKDCPTSRENSARRLPLESNFSITSSLGSHLCHTSFALPACTESLRDVPQDHFEGEKTQALLTMVLDPSRLHPSNSESQELRGKLQSSQRRSFLNILKSHWFLRKREGGREERDLLVHLFIHSWVASSMWPGTMELPRQGQPEASIWSIKIPMTKKEMLHKAFRIKLRLRGIKNGEKCNK